MSFWENVKAGWDAQRGPLRVPGVKYYREIRCACSNEECDLVTREELFLGVDIELLHPEDYPGEEGEEAGEAAEKSAAKIVLWIFAGKVLAVALLVLGYLWGWFDGVLK